MAQYYDTTDLLSSIKRRINIPVSQITFTDEDLLAFANEELGLSVVPAIMKLHEDYLLFSEDVLFLGSPGNYPIPYRAVGNKLYDLQYVDSSGNVFSMIRTTEGDEPNYHGFNATNQQYAYYLKNNRVIPLPANGGSNTTGSLRFIYFIRPAELVTMNQIGIINSINTTTGEIVIDSTPSGFSANVRYDLYKVQSPHSIMAIDLVPISVNALTNTIQLDPDELPTELQVGDHLSIATTAGIPQIPSDLHVFLAQKVAERVLEAQGDIQGLQAAQAKSQEMEFRSGTLIDNRVDESPIKLIARNGVLRSGLRSRYYKRRG